MSQERKRRAGAALAVAGAIAAAACVGPVVTWPFGLVLAVAVVVAGLLLVTDHERPVRPYDHARDGT